MNRIVNSLPCKFYDRPAKKFVREFIAGMMISKSTVLTNVVRSLSIYKHDFKPNYKRIKRRLGEVELTVTHEKQKRRAFEEISDDTVIAIDPSDITKLIPKHFNALSKSPMAQMNIELSPALISKERLL